MNTLKWQVNTQACVVVRCEPGTLDPPWSGIGQCDGPIWKTCFDRQGRFGLCNTSGHLRLRLPFRSQKLSPTVARMPSRQNGRDRARTDPSTDRQFEMVCRRGLSLWQSRTFPQRLSRFPPVPDIPRLPRSFFLHPPQSPRLARCLQSPTNTNTSGKTSDGFGCRGIQSESHSGWISFRIDDEEKLWRN